MKIISKHIALITIFTLLSIPLISQTSMNKIILVVHGGAGTITKQSMTPEKEKAYTEGLTVALEAGYKILKNRGSSLDAVSAAVVTLEDNPLFNAGKGSVFTSEGKNEMDASIMDGKTRKAGAVASVNTIKNPIKAARLVMDKSPHVLMTGKGAIRFAQENGLEIVDSSYFHTDFRYDQWQKSIKHDKIQLDHSGDKDPKGWLKTETEKKFGTVGAVALDANGNLAAATSTGGMTNKKWGRIGDSPIIGAGTYANNNTCAVSCTGHGEYFIRDVVAYDISALMEYKKLSLKDAAEEVVMKKLVTDGGEGGIIAVDKDGNYTMTFNSEGMYRGVITADGKVWVGIYK
ncbi:MAG: beta-aspartyl-peptidase [Bacteroidetes bacterium RIFCSPLOWO2_02_FULL_36_8]|nr:MAG: beta-aspartyl-peptidase [Bacteroidetes bacterium RIFCSPLOWO2_02_FULL_36_8]OFY71783.1 MAG: beta-aspartyl-peptidase [Bacteroidetes bacterium RIFCSPLOWO2_12_FULL_37_12]